MNLSFDNKVALVTGAAMGMGLATARMFSVAGAAVVLADHDEEALGQAVAGLEAAGHRVLGLRCDVSDAAAVATMVERTVDTFGRLDAAFNNAGIQIPANDVADVPDADYERVMAVNLRGVCGRRADASSPPAGPRRFASSRWRGRSTTASTMPTAPSTGAAGILSR